MRPQRSGATTSAGQKPIQREICHEKYAPSMKTLAWAKLSTPIMLKMSVRPLDSMKSRSPYTAPLRSEKATISRTGPRLSRAAWPPALRPRHLAGRGHGGVRRGDLLVRLEAQAALLHVVLRLVREGRDEERLQVLVVVRAHLGGAERRVHPQALERLRDLHRVVRLRLLRRRLQHVEHVAHAPVVELVGLVREALL